MPARKLDQLPEPLRTEIIRRYKEGDSGPTICRWFNDDHTDTGITLYDQDVYAILENAGIPRRGPGGTENLGRSYYRVPRT